MIVSFLCILWRYYEKTFNRLSDSVADAGEYVSHLGC